MIFCKCRKYPYDIEEYINRMLKKSREYRELYEKYIRLEARFNFLKATGKDIADSQYWDDEVKP